MSGTVSGRPDVADGSEGLDRSDQGPRLSISEIFGPTIQGEGISIGHPAIFVRTAGCHLSCRWCDTRYSWDWSRYDRATETKSMTAVQAWTQVLALASGSGTLALVLTGGEPAAQAKGLFGLASAAKRAGWWVEMETSGSIDPGPLLGLLDLVTVSPKLAGSGIEEKHRIRPGVLQRLAEREETVFKFVVDDIADLDEADRLVAEHRPARVMLMAQATTAEAVLERTAWLVPHAVARGWVVTPRLHVLLWGDERGR